MRRDHKHGLKLSKPILKQMIINPHSPYLYHATQFLILPKNSLKTQHRIKVEKKK